MRLEHLPSLRKPLADLAFRSVLVFVCVFITSWGYPTPARAGVNSPLGQGLDFHAEELNPSYSIKTIRPNRPSELVGIDNAQDGHSMWDQLRKQFAIPDLYMREVLVQERELLKNPQRLIGLLANSEPYIHYIASECEKRGLPAELALVPFIESRFNPHATSPAQAEGLWQIIPTTGKYFELKTNQWVNERRDIMASTRVALDYLTTLYDMFGDWHLALMAYNWGEGSIQRAVKTAQNKGKHPNLGNLDVPEETRLYVPKLQAIKNIIQFPEKYGIELPHLPNAPYFVAVPQKAGTDLRSLSKRTGVDLEVLKALNAGLNGNTVAAHYNKVLMPTSAALQAKTWVVKASTSPAKGKSAPSAARAPIVKRGGAFKSYEVKLGDSLGDIAKRFNQAPHELIALNSHAKQGLKPGMLISIPN